MELVKVGHTIRRPEDTSTGVDESVRLYDTGRTPWMHNAMFVSTNTKKVESSANDMSK